VTTRPFLVLRNQECVPLEGPYRAEEHEGRWYVLGHHRAIECEDESRARLDVQRLTETQDVHALTAEALESLPDGYDVVSARN